MFCPRCGGHVGDLDGFCRSCGTNLSLPAAQSRQEPPEGSRSGRSGIWRWIVFPPLALLVFVAILVFVLAPKDNSDEPAVAYCCTAPDANAQAAPESHAPTTDDAQTSTATDIQTPTATAEALLQSEQRASTQQEASYKIGDSFSVGYWSYECNRAFWTSILGNPLSIERANSEFLVIDITVRNDDASASVLPPFHLLDQQGRTYDESSDAMLGQGFFSPLESLNPGVSKRGRVAFDVPVDRQYVLSVSGGIESGKNVTVQIPAPADDAQPAAGPN